MCDEFGMQVVSANKDRTHKAIPACIQKPVWFKLFIYLFLNYMSNI